MNFSNSRRFLAAFGVVLALSGCANMRSHDQLAGQMQTAQKTGGIPAALKALEASTNSDDQRAAMLYNMERGELLRLDRKYDDSTKAFLLADVKVREWEEAAKTNPERLLSTLGAATISERLKVYEGQDYEKVWLTTRLALNRVAAGDMDNARVDIKRTHEREAVIAEFRAKETSTAEEEAKAKGVSSKGKEINGYPVETLNDPEVLALKNGYQNALSHYLAGFLYEVLNEPGMAAPGYRKAIELKPETGVLEEGLRGLDDRTSFTHKRRQRMTDVLFVVEAGDAPARKAKGFTLPVPVGNKIRTVSISYPTIAPSTDPVLSNLSVAGRDFKLEKVVDVNVMARRALKDEMPGMVFRGVTRAIVKGVMQDQLEKKTGLLGAVIGSVASAVTEQADDRLWRMLPGRVYVARGYLPEGEHKVVINGQDFNINVKVGGQYALVPLRLYNQSVVVGAVGNFGQLAALPPVVVAEAQIPTVIATEAVEVKSKNKAKPTAKKPVLKTDVAVTAKPTL